MNIWIFIERIDITLSIITAIFSGYAAYQLWRQSRRAREITRLTQRIDNFQQLIRNFEGIRTKKPVAFCLALLPNIPSIKSDVQTFLTYKKWNMPIEELNMSGINNNDDLEIFVTQVQEKKRYFQAMGYTEVHLFIAGPIQTGTILGALFDNWLPVKIYHKESPPPPEVYKYWMPLIGS